MEFNELEIWKDVGNYSGYYQVSNLGRIKSLGRLDTIGRKLKTKILKPNINKSLGYPMVSFHKDSIASVHLVHRLVAIAFIPNPFNLPEVNHIDGDKTNNSCCNLEWTSKKDNAIHAVKNGLRSNVGESSPWSKLKEYEVLEIRQLWDKNLLTRKELSEKYNMSYNAIQGIINKRSWKYI